MLGPWIKDARDWASSSQVNINLINFFQTSFIYIEYFVVCYFRKRLYLNIMQEIRSLFGVLTEKLLTMQINNGQVM